jgi:hypothetical protein
MQLRSCEERNMLIIDGRYETKLSTTFETVEEAIDEIKKKIQKSRRIRISNIPMSMLEELKPHLKEKDLKIVLPIGEKPDEELKKLGEVATTKARIYVDFKGKEANSGSINFSDIIFNVVWIDDEILNVSTMEYGKCIKCLSETFEGGWRYSQKW